MEEWHWSPFMIPLGAFVVGIVAIVSGVVAGAYKQRLKTEQRLAMLARGMSAGEIDKVLNADGRAAKDPLQGIASTRRTAIVLISTGIGLMLFFLVLAWIVDHHEVLSGGAVGLIPLSIGVGFLIDYKLQKRDLSHFGLEVGRGE
jgi:Domain of unknown function (DUF6249)